MPVSHTSYWLEYKIGQLLSTDVADQKQSYLLPKLRIKNTWKENKVRLAAHFLIISDLVRLRCKCEKLASAVEVQYISNLSQSLNNIMLVLGFMIPF